MKRIPDALQRGPASYALLALLGVVIGALLVPPAVGAVAGPDGTVAVVTLDEPITGSIADQTIQELRDVRRNDSVDAVVLRVDSGGGSVTGSEAQYRAVKRADRALGQYELPELFPQQTWEGERPDLDYDLRADARFDVPRRFEAMAHDLADRVDATVPN